ncbi:S26 family signal peptidase [Plantactinospora sp. S1510]|uniref:S26 family signal peptidase n=1 Tax=Plantactinospora alkalitolerans TaxID=2789879 RepID=A0ABS0GWF0_9ACTN|nr:S26 family signal peptidase [Plantactinospora alkalitolerans]MBF9130513.1 S26 family signal peptidase [Plantactinospora alkalitolerans]
MAWPAGPDWPIELGRWLGDGSAPVWVTAAAGVLLGLCGLAISGWILRRHLALLEVYGPSMTPTLVPGDRVLVRRISARRVRAGDIVVIERSGFDGRWALPPLSGRLQERDWVIKRAAAVPGDSVPAVVAPVLGVPAGTPVPEGNLVVLGDNPARSTDSRSWGYLPANRLLGVVRRRLPRG